ncbi:ATP12 family chaperone protein [Seohaeicola zhoushanensis]|uniref:ATPase n=1 Tax=Seohaeicola zhoushanensis TaxID=1569283 RepID=A0A8J3GZI1_9RHOB|nr:ATP12 family protein [Seohaeicola zhoushanensis]GHF63222.1 ATPase [Seohaeicola zhoushanensis]
MSDWKPRVFWKEAAVIPAENGFAVQLDGRPVKTPAKRALVLPTQGLAEAVAEEWAAQDKVVDPGTMPVTRTANAAIDKVATQHRQVAEMLAGYGDSDLLCYRAEAPEELVALQAAEWDPALDWAEAALGARLAAHAGVMHRPQDAAMLERLAGRVLALDAFRLAAFHDLVSLSGSLILGFAAAENWKEAEEIWRISRLEELWQIEHWGEDEEARDSAERKRRDFLQAKRFFDLA